MINKYVVNKDFPIIIYEIEINIAIPINLSS